MIVEIILITLLIIFGTLYFIEVFKAMITFKLVIIVILSITLIVLLYDVNIFDNINEIKKIYFKIKSYARTATNFISSSNSFFI